MNRQAVMLSVLVGILVLVAYFLLLLKPKMDEVTELDDRVVAVQDEQITLRSRIAALEDVRSRAPEIEASIATTEAVLPRDPALPSALRQLQLAADESGVRLLSVSTGRPEAASSVEEINISVSLEGGYFQLVDFFRRVEDPTISPRAIKWQSVSVAASEYPVLAASSSGVMFTVGTAPPPPPPESTTTPEGEPTDGATEEAA